ncbi:MAG: hypothetical protein INR73_23330 [Williamsia sp.]|nr:hypothetical protein [Williamsia sp.]
MKKLFLSAVIGLSAFVAHAQTSSSVSQTVTLTLVNAINISITSATGTNFTFDDVSKYQNGLTNLNAATVQIKSNRPWIATVKTATANFAGPANSPAMPASVLGIRQSGTNSAFGYLSTTGFTYGTGDRGTSSYSVDYNAVPGFNYDAGTYTISVVFTATQQ